MREIGTRIDLVETLESGQTFVWRRQTDGDGFSTAVEGEGVRVYQDDHEEGVRYETTGASEKAVRRLLGLDDPLDEIHDEISHDELVRRGIDEYPGLRVVNDEFFACTVSFIISAQNRIPRIKSLVDEIRRRYGEPIEGYDAYVFPSPETLAEAGEEELREIGLGYRAPYVVETARMVADGEVDPGEVRRMEYVDAHDEVKRLMGVGDKVADCILLFSLGFNEAVPIDTWIDEAIETYYPDLAGSSYSETSENFRDYFGEYAGYAQNYIFHYIRNHEIR